jgi:hypothetical protein
VRSAISSFVQRQETKKDAHFVSTSSKLTVAFSPHYRVIVFFFVVLQFLFKHKKQSDFNLNKNEDDQ